VCWFHLGKFGWILVGNCMAFLSHMNAVEDEAHFVLEYTLYNLHRR